MGVPEGCQTGSKTAKNGRPFSAKSGSGGSKLVEQCGTRVEQVRAHPWGCIGTVLGVREGHVGVPEGSQKGPKQPFSAISGSGRPKKAPLTPVLKVDAHCAHVRRTKESWEDQKAG